MGRAEDTAADALLEERFEFQELLGSGAMGTVYRALDRRRGTVVAVKQLKRVLAGALFSFKAEFRNLANLAHPNLLQLYELVARGDEWLLTMELVEGTDFMRFVRPSEESEEDSAAPQAADSLDESTAPGADAGPSVAGSTACAVASLALPRRAPRKLGPLDEARLRSALGQLAEGLRALHAHDYLHRDLKPDNVLVFAQTGRLVICDFGLVVVEAKTRLARKPTGESADSSASTTRSALGQLAGTLAFMAPEQANGLPLSSATDWYAVGVMLYMALTLEVPIKPQASLELTARAKLYQQPRDPRALHPQAPADLSELAMALLAPDPALRAGFEQVSACVAASRVRSSLHASLARAGAWLDPRGNEVLLGRAAQLAQLHAAFERASAGQFGQVFVSGASGMGKSAVVRHFLHGAEASAGAIILSARCYEREELPYKAFDPLLDALCAYLLELEAEELEALLPSNIEDLAWVFPTLRRLPPIEARMNTYPSGHDVLERRRLAADALWELCRRISARKPLILYIDDLQWGDLDSAAFFARFQLDGERAAVLLVCAYRSEDRTRSPLLAALWASEAERASESPIEHVSVAALDPSDAMALALSMLPVGAEHEQLAEQIVREALGSPFFIRELAAFVRERALDDGALGLRLEHVVMARLDALNAETRLMLEIVVTAGRPERREVLEAAAGLGALGFGTLRALEQQNLVQSGGAAAAARIEPYHDRIRETAYDALVPARRADLHRRLAEALERLGATEAEALFRHWKGSGDRERARRYAVEAAENAERTAAFARAAALYEEAAGLLPEHGEAWSELQERGAQALVLAGRGVDAADAFERAAQASVGERQKALRVRCQVELLRSGRIDAALAGLTAHGEATGLRLPQTQLGSIFMLLLRRLRIRLSRRPKVLAEQSVSRALSARVERLWEIASSLASVDFLRGNVYSAELTLCALQARGTRQLSFAYAMETISAAAGGDGKRCDDYATRSIEAAEQNGDAYTRATARGTVGVARLLRGDWAEARRLAQESQRLHRLNPRGAWDVATMMFWDLQAAAQLGEVSDLTRQIPDALRDAESRGDLFASTYFRTLRSTWAWLGPDQPGVARSELITAERNWRAPGYQLPHYYITLALAELDMYDGQPAASLARLNAEWKRTVLVRNIQHARCELLWLRARLCLASARKRLDPALLRVARGDARALAGERRPWQVALAMLLQAGLASFDEPARAEPLLRDAAAGFTALGMKLHAAAAESRLGQLLPGSEGAQLLSAAELGIRSSGVKRPENFVRLLAPGFPQLPA